MSRIRVLPEILSNKIAAGEVVERPASVVKELVENCLDAGATHISVELEKGGRSLIRVSDNGSGMNRDDALLALERYATSKIYRDEDLSCIHTLGFRGEALPSIGAVSRLALTTREADAETGTRIQMDGGKLADVREVGAPVGTMVRVGQLFYNTPARRKFLKTIATETAHIMDVLASMALAWPRVRFEVIHNSRVVKRWVATEDGRQRAADVLGPAHADRLLPVDRRTSDLEITGWLADPGTTRSSARGIYTFVNRRLVKDRLISHALQEGFSGRLMKGQYPVAVIFLTLPGERVDVNVHPTKHEVRFVQPGPVHSEVAAAVARALDRADAPEKTRKPAAIPSAAGGSGQVSESRPHTYSTISPKEAARGAADPSAAPAPAIPNAPPRTAPISDPPNPDPVLQPQSPVDLRDPLAPPGGRLRQDDLWKRPPFRDLRVIGQLKNSYILCEDAHGLILIDQHAAHERVLFEQLKAAAHQERPTAQRLLIPETIELGYAEAAAMADLIPRLARYGLEVEPFGGNTVVVGSVPGLLSQREIKPLIQQMVDQVLSVGAGAGIEKTLEACLMLMACHGAIRAHQPLSEAQMTGLLSQMDACGNPSHCPHGRPTWLRWPIRYVAKAFRRTV